MIRTFVLLLAILAASAAVVLAGLLTNWFRYGVSLEATLVLAATVIAVAIVGIVSYIAYKRNSGGWVAVDVVLVIASTVLILLVYDHAIGGLPHLYATHKETGPTAVLQTQRGDLKYRIELEDPFSTKHAEFLVLDDGKERRIPIQIFAGQPKGYASAAKPADWGTLVLTADPNIAILTVGPLLNPSNQRFRIDLVKDTATKLPQ